MLSTYIIAMFPYGGILFPPKGEGISARRQKLSQEEVLITFTPPCIPSDLPF